MTPHSPHVCACIVYESGNLVRRILYVIREEYANKLRYAYAHHMHLLLLSSHRSIGQHDDDAAEGLPSRTHRQVWGADITDSKKRYFFCMVLDACWAVPL